MGQLTALVLATPIFGLSLTPPQLDASAAATPFSSQAVMASLAAADGDAEAAEPGDSGGGGGSDFATKLKERAEIAQVHRAFGIATWASMTATVVLGGIQYHNLYGGGRDSNPCVTGDAVFGQGQCTGTPWVHLGSALVTTALYSTTFALSLLMPDPGGLDEGDSEYAKTLRTHKALRWVHLGGMVAQFLLGIVIANGEAFGLDRANDYGTLKALSAVHMATGLVTWGATTWAGAIMLK
jgi:hypothetical protein